MKVKNFEGFIRSRKINETSLSSDWDADYGLSQGPIDSDTKMNMDINAGLFTTDQSEYDLDSGEQEEELVDKEDLDEPISSNDKISTKDLKSLVIDLVSRVDRLEKIVDGSLE